MQGHCWRGRERCSREGQRKREKRERRSNYGTQEKGGTRVERQCVAPRKGDDEAATFNLFFKVFFQF